jgi:uncharacterized membrane protein
MRLRAHGSRALAAIMVVAILLRFALSPLYAYLPGRFLDEGFWKQWMQHIDEGGVLNVFRTSDANYVGYQWVLWLLSIIYSWIGGPYDPRTPSLHVLVKTPPIMFDLVLIGVVFVATRALARESGAHEKRAVQLALAAAAVIAVHPAVVYDSAVWSQTDSAITVAMLGAVLLAQRGNALAAGVVLGLGFAVKPHPVIVLPLVLLLCARAGGWRAAALSGASSQHRAVAGARRGCAYRRRVPQPLHH